MRLKLIEKLMPDDILHSCPRGWAEIGRGEGMKALRYAGRGRVAIGSTKGIAQVVKFYPD